MESSNRRLSAHSCQEDAVCQKKSNQSCHSLSKSSSALASSGQEGSQNARNCVHKSLNSIFCMTEYTEDSIQHIQSTEWPPVDDVLDLFPQHMNYSDYAIDHMDEKPQHINHYLAVDSSLAPRDEGGTESIVGCKTSENLSLLGHPRFDVQIVDHLETRATGVQKSYSDFFCGGRNPLSGPTIAKNRSSTTYSALCSSSSFSGSCSDGASSTTNDSGTVCSPSTNQNNLTEMIYSAKDESMLQGNLNNSTIQHNITIYAVPGTYEHGVLGPRNSGNGFPHNRHICSQPYYNIPGVMSCDNISETRHSPPSMIIHNNCTQHCCRSHESVIKTDDTIAAYCHAMPISSVQFSSGLDCSHCESDLGQPPVQFYSLLHPPLVFPKLVSSVSESGLDAKKLIRCGRLAFPAPPMAVDNLQLKHSSTRGSSDLLIKSSEILTDNLQTEDPCTKMKDTWTMTSMNCFCAGQKLPLGFRDVEVQTVIIVENKSVSTSPCRNHSGHSHLFPDVGLTLNLQCPKSPVREVRWDEEGMTWEVYGAAVDPEVLGLAIQKHLEIQIEQNLQSEHSGDNTMNPPTKEKRRSLRNVMHSLRQSNCCVRTNATSE